MTVHELDQRITSREISEWVAFEKVFGPLGQGRDDIHTALLLAMVHNQWAKTPRQPEDFMPEWDQKPKSPEELQQLGRAWVSMFGGSDDADS